MQLLVDPELATYLVRRLPHPEGRNLESFANRALRKEEAETGQEEGVRERAGRLGGGPQGFLSAALEKLNEAQLAQVTDPGIIDKDCKRLDEVPLLVPTTAFIDLANHFRRLANEMRTVLDTLQSQPGVIYRPPP